MWSLQALLVAVGFPPEADLRHPTYFRRTGVSPEADFQLACRNQGRVKWLKDRKNRELSLEDIRHYCRVVTALSKTIGLQKELDAFYPEIETATIIFD